MGATAKGKVITVPLVDKTLSVEGAAAEARAAGESVRKLKNKPAGNYVGTGSAEKKIIEINAISNLLFVCSDMYSVQVTPCGAIAFRTDGTGVEWIPEVTFAGNLSIETDHEALNALNVTYSYQVL